MLLAAFIINYFNEKRHTAMKAAVAGKHHHHIITVGSEREEFFCPGDRMKIDSHDWNNQDFD
ncbi:MAG: hypothetical protein HDS75_02685 [Bacteroidales bacterium]|nr:hypothetical protein [Bacteroidales bacterium]